MGLSKQTTVALKAITARANAAQKIVTRAKILLAIDEHLSIPTAAALAGVSTKTVRRWHERFVGSYEPAADYCEAALELLLNDAPRTGAPLIYSPEEQCAVVGIALQEPATFGRPITHWTPRELADEARKQNISTAHRCQDQRLNGRAKQISARTVGRILAQAALKPHQIKYWENPKIEDPEHHPVEVAAVCEEYAKALERHAAGGYTVSVDEKTGIQALERIHPDKPMLPGKVAKLEFEYKRHGTRALIPSYNVATGQIMAHRIGPTRKEQDFAALLKATIDAAPEAEWVLVMDQLNTHMSESVVRLIAGYIGYEGDLGLKGQRGILGCMASRKKFLSDKSHRIRIVYTPKHCSWLNQIEIWFSFGIQVIYPKVIDGII